MKAKAEENQIPWQPEVMAGHTGTNGWHMQISREGVATSVISLPLKYMHTPIEVLALEDMESVARLLAAFTPGCWPPLPRAWERRRKSCAERYHSRAVSAGRCVQL